MKDRDDYFDAMREAGWAVVAFIIAGLLLAAAFGGVFYVIMEWWA